LIEHELTNIFPDWKGALNVKFLKPVVVNEEFRIEFENLDNTIIQVSLNLTNNNLTAVSGNVTVRNI